MSVTTAEKAQVIAENQRASLFEAADNGSGKMRRWGRGILQYAVDSIANA